MSQTIALVDDDRNILTSISMALENEGFGVQTYIDAESALVGISRNPPDLAVIDIKMPRMDGEELLKRLRKKTSIPILFLTSKDEEVDELLGLKLGADDFIKKSGGFSMKVLIERIRVQLRKKTTNVDDSKNLIKHGKLKLDPNQLECEWDGKALPEKLTTTEFSIVKESRKYRPHITVNAVSQKKKLSNFPPVPILIKGFPSKSETILGTIFFLAISNVEFSNSRKSCFLILLFNLSFSFFS